MNIYQQITEYCTVREEACWLLSDDILQVCMAEKDEIPQQLIAGGMMVNNQFIEMVFIFGSCIGY